VTGLLRRTVRYELAMWRSLARWIARRPAGIGPGAEAFGYTRSVTPIMWTVIVVSAIEVPAVDLLLPWPSVRKVALGLGIWGLVWMVGALAMIRVHPHVVDPHGLRIRRGIAVDIRIPWDAVAEVRATTRTLPSGRRVQIEDDLLRLPMLSQTNVDVLLHRPVTVALPGGHSTAITAVHCWADDPKALAARSRRGVDAKNS
jgi:hypothetical protein